MVVDIGNTRVKVAVVCGDEVCEEMSFELLDRERHSTIKRVVERHSLHRAILSSTRGDAELREIATRLHCLIDEVLIFDSSTPIPIKNSYSTPESLGCDRLAAAVGAWSLYGQTADAVVIVDLGSAITIDLVTQDGGFEGGVISPGVAMRFRSLHEFTAKLPLCSPTDEVLEVARSTKEAIEQGVMEGVTFEIEGHIDKITARYKKNIVIFAGGDAKKLAKRIKNTIFARRELVLVGLNRILEYNAK